MNLVIRMTKINLIILRTLINLIIRTTLINLIALMNLVKLMSLITRVTNDPYKNNLVVVVSRINFMARHILSKLFIFSDFALLLA